MHLWDSYKCMEQLHYSHAQMQWNKDSCSGRAGNVCLGLESAGHSDGATVDVMLVVFTGMDVQRT